MLFKDNSHWLQRCKRVCEQENRKIGDAKGDMDQDRKNHYSFIFF